MPPPPWSFSMKNICQRLRRKEFSLNNNGILEARRRHGIQIQDKKREYPMECA
jgi:hypothetical protein